MLRYLMIPIFSLVLVTGNITTYPNFVYAQQIVEEDEEDNEVEFTSAVITALPCAEEAEEKGELDILVSCPPHKAFEGVKDIYDNPPNIVVVDVTEGEYFYIQPSKESVYYSDLLEGFGGSIDGIGMIIGEKNGIPVVELEEFEITPKPKPGFFKGCL